MNETGELVITRNNTEMRQAAPQNPAGKSLQPSLNTHVESDQQNAGKTKKIKEVIDIDDVRELLKELNSLTKEEAKAYLEQWKKDKQKNSKKDLGVSDEAIDEDPKDDDEKPKLTVDLAAQLKRTLFIIISSLVQHILEPEKIHKGQEFLPTTPPDGQIENRTTEHSKLKDESWGKVLKGMEKAEGTAIDLMAIALALNAENPPIKIKAKRRKAAELSMFRRKGASPHRRATPVLKRGAFALAT